jgi:hypothetical protein
MNRMVELWTSQDPNLGDEECLDYRHPFGACDCSWGKLNPNEPLAQAFARRRKIMIMEAWMAGLVELEP